ncbi:hypothetical protein K466DRAFT_653994 [Polyporus arcularius HHB13444]|uniref:Uncharacterized protein n=1 Tax=Polyporus arcularius HHB13444 TaxID=1314778 RepID=A0A5C3PAJ9_9APHY|nr:hypothetical protein K466DRAFT_653994 [Polyporus arcularius HHB13444]
MATSTAVQEQYCFADVVHALTGEPPSPYSEWPGGRLYSLAALFAYTLAHPAQFLEWAHQSWKANRSDSPDKRLEWAKVKHDVRHFFALWHLALCGERDLLRGPLDLSRSMFIDYNGTRPRKRVRGRIWAPPETEWVRLRWYPDVEATRKWPDDLGLVWVDLQRGPEGGLDLTPAIRFLGMENCYVIDANRGKPQLSRKPVETLSALAVQVLLGEEKEGVDRHGVIGIVEQPTQLMQEARELRAWLKGRRYFLEDFLQLRAPTLLAEAYAHSVRFLYEIADKVSSTVLLCFLAVFVVLLLTIADTTRLALAHSKVVWPLLMAVLLPVFWLVVESVMRSVRATWPWIRATMEAALLNEEEIEEWERLQRGDPPSESVFVE